MHGSQWAPTNIDENPMAKKKTPGFMGVTVSNASMHRSQAAHVTPQKTCSFGAVRQIGQALFYLN